jgi:hypothetical protein
MFKLIFYAIGKWWHGLSDELKFTFWWITWMVPLYIAALKGGTGPWVAFLVIFALDILWFAYDTYVEAIQKADEARRKKLKEQSHEMLRILCYNKEEK